MGDNTQQSSLSQVSDEKKDSSNNSCQIGKWYQLSPNLDINTTSSTAANNKNIPLPRSSTSIGYINNILYVFGGENQPRVPINNTIYRFDVVKKQWIDSIGFPNDETNQGVPHARVGHGSATIGNQIYVYGGRTAYEHESNSLDDLWKYDTIKNEWKKIESKGSSPGKLSYFGITSYTDVHTNQSYVVIFGGCPEKGRSNKLYRYSVASNEWELLSGNESNNQNTPAERGGASIAVDNVRSHIYVMFGYNGKHELSDQYIFELNTKQWNQINTSLSQSEGPEARSVTDLVYLPAASNNTGESGKLFVFGGESSPSSRGHMGSGNFLNSAWLYDIQKHSWRCVIANDDSENDVNASRRPLARGWFNTVRSSADSIILFGGLAADDVRVNDIWQWKFTE